MFATRLDGWVGKRLGCPNYSTVVGVPSLLLFESCYAVLPGYFVMQRAREQAVNVAKYGMLRDFRGVRH